MNHVEIHQLLPALTLINLKFLIPRLDFRAVSEAPHPLVISIVHSLLMPSHTHALDRRRRQTIEDVGQALL
jgi:hypothetical protein